jgi:hypothetical protein
LAINVSLDLLLGYRTTAWALKLCVQVVRSHYLSLRLRAPCCRSVKLTEFGRRRSVLVTRRPDARPNAASFPPHGNGHRR